MRWRDRDRRRARLPGEPLDRDGRFGGSDGLDLIDALIRAAPDRLRPEGLLILECGAGQAGRITARLAADGHYAPARLV